MINFWRFNKAKNTVTSFYLDPEDFSKWMQQNKGEYTGNFVDDVLIDSFVVAAKRGYAFFYEHTINSCCSNFEVYFIPYESGKKHLRAYDQLWANWLEFEERRNEK